MKLGKYCCLHKEDVYVYAVKSPSRCTMDLSALDHPGAPLGNAFMVLV